MTPDPLAQLRAAVRRETKGSSLKKFAAQNDDVRVGEVRSLIDGRPCKSSTIQKLCETVDYEFYVGPRRKVHIDKPEPGDVIQVKDSRLGRMLTAIVSAWEAGSSFERGHLLGRFDLTFMNEQSATKSSSREVRWIGWQTRSNRSTTEEGDS